MKEKPILFSGEMVRAILDGRKTQTRRVVDGFTPPECPGKHECRFEDGVGKWYLDGQLATLPGEWLKPKYGLTGDRLWVRESFFQYGHWESVPGVKTNTGRTKWKFVPDGDEILFTLEDGFFRKGRHHKDPESAAWHKRLGRFMPRKASRITLEITAVRVERLRDISRGDCMAEGCPFQNMESANPINWYAELWESINGAGSWAKNPWVWVIEFKRV